MFDEKRFHAIKRAIANAVNETEEIPHLLIALARIPDSEWQEMIDNGKAYRIIKQECICALCSLPYIARTHSSLHSEVCDKCMEASKDIMRDSYLLNLHRSRARKANLPDHLKLSEWIVTKRYFKNKCAYCRTGKYEVMEHFIPISLGEGGTIASNVVPACIACNCKKKHNHPNKVTAIPRKDLERVRIYLESRK